MPLRDRTTWLHGDFFHCLQPPAAFGRTWRLVLLGPPGVGKGTQANLLAAVLGACPLSTGDIFRAAGERSSAPGMAEALARVHRGELVPDDFVLGLIRNRRRCLRCETGFLLDGFPRTVAQAATLDGLLEADHLQLDAVILYELPIAELTARLSNRRVCNACQAPYHTISHPPRQPGVCDHCGGPVVQRRDDEPAAVRTRLADYAAATAQVADYYRRRNLLVWLSAAAKPEAILRHTLDRLATRGLPVPRITPSKTTASA